jgi:hypothetical protein
LGVQPTEVSETIELKVSRVKLLSNDELKDLDGELSTYRLWIWNEWGGRVLSGKITRDGLMETYGYSKGSVSKMVKIAEAYKINKAFRACVDKGNLGIKRAYELAGEAIGVVPTSRQAVSVVDSFVSKFEKLSKADQAKVLRRIGK